MQRAIKKYGIENFHLVIFYIDDDPSIKLTDIETVVIKSFPFDGLYNYKKEASSLLGYKHTKEAIEKMKNRFKDKSNHPMHGKKHSVFALSKISKPGALNPMFNKTHSVESRKKISIRLSKKVIGLYNADNTLIKRFSNQVEVAVFFNLHKTTIGRYLKSGKILLKKYFIRIIEPTSL